MLMVREGRFIPLYSANAKTVEPHVESSWRGRHGVEYDQARCRIKQRGAEEERAAQRPLILDGACVQFMGAGKLRVNT